MTASDDLLRDYRAAFLRHLSRRDEDTLAHGYSLGRRALDEGASPLDLVRAHHLVLAELGPTPLAQASDTAMVASEFLVEALSSFEMTRSVSPQAGENGA